MAGQPPLPPAPPPGPPPGPPPPQPYGMPPAPQQPPQWPGSQQRAPLKTDGFAIAALVLSILGGVVLAVIFAIVALFRIRDGKRKGKGLAITALVISALWVVIIAGGVLLVVLTDESNSERYTGAEQPIAQVLDDFEEAAGANDGERMCALMTPELAAAQAEGDKACPERLEDDIGFTDIEAESIELSGPDRAQARVDELGDKSTWDFERRDGRWLIADIR